MDTHFTNDNLVMYESMNVVARGDGGGGLFFFILPIKINQGWVKAGFF